ncbi:hypothetical protein KEM48_005514 [Puccinia striiformis f. sp. tritici PST-130]|nr:hypothetical protein KEM48_005514 [Puccinia striiformis f. sp. tritici PST-130]
MKLLNSLYLIALSSSTTLADQLHAGVQLNQNDFDPSSRTDHEYAGVPPALADKMKHYESKGLKMGKNGGTPIPAETRRISAGSPCVSRRDAPFHAVAEDICIGPSHRSSSSASRSEDTTLKPIPTMPIDTPLELPNPHGHVLSLTKDNWESYMNPSNNPFPIFIQFHTFWCKECRALVPDWEEVARLLKNEVLEAYVIAKPNGQEDLEMKHVNEFPSFSIRHDASQLGYGAPTWHPRWLSLFAIASPPEPSRIQSIPGRTKLHPGVVPSDHNEPYILFFPALEPYTGLDCQLCPNGQQSLLGSAAILNRTTRTFTTDQAVHFTPVPVMLPRSMRRSHEQSLCWTLSLEAGLKPTFRFRKLAIDLEKSNPRSVQLKDEMKAWAVQWQKSQAARGVEDLTVDWVWVNSDVWADWLRTTYAVNLPRPTEDPRESSMIIIVDAEHHRYYCNQENGRDIEFKSAQVFQTLLAVEMGKLSGKLTGTFSSRMYWRFQRFKHSIGFLFQPHWLLFWTVLFGIIAYSVRKHLASPSHIRVGYTPISPQMSKAFYSHSSAGVSSPDSYGSKSPGFGSVFGLASNVPCKAD